MSTPPTAVWMVAAAALGWAAVAGVGYAVAGHDDGPRTHAASAVVAVTSSPTAPAPTALASASPVAVPAATPPPAPPVPSTTAPPVTVTTAPASTPAPSATSTATLRSTATCDGVQLAQRAAAHGSGQGVFQRGRVTSTAGGRLAVRSDDGGVRDYALDVHTAFGHRQGGNGVRPGVGDRVVVAGSQRGGALVAWWVLVGDGCTAGG